MENNFLLYFCFDCKKKHNVNAQDPKQDGRACIYCGGHATVYDVGIDLSTTEDITNIGEQNMKACRIEVSTELLMTQLGLENPKDIIIFAVQAHPK